MATLFNLGSVGEGLPHAENTGLVISDIAKVQQIILLATLFHSFFHFFLQKQSLPSFSKPIVYKVLNFFVQQELVAICDQFKSRKHSTTESFVFTEYVVSMLPSVLNSQKAVDISIRIIDGFVAMRRIMMQNAAVLMRIAHLKKHNTNIPK